MKVPDTVFVALERVLRHTDPDWKERKYLEKWMRAAKARRSAWREEQERKRHDRLMARA